jgi:predicted RNase H-like HicB family nuclease
VVVCIGYELREVHWLPHKRHYYDVKDARPNALRALDRGPLKPTPNGILKYGHHLQRSVKLHAIIWKEEDMFVIKEVFTGVTTQGKTIEEAMENLKEAMELYLEEMPEIAAEIENIETVGTLNVEITKTVR